MRDYFQKSPNVNSRIVNSICHVLYPSGKPRILHLLCCLPGRSLGEGWSRVRSM